MVKAPTHPEGEDPRRLRALRPSSPAQPTNLAPGWMGAGGGTQLAPESTGRVGLPCRSSTSPLLLCKNLAPREAPRPHPSPYPGCSWGRVVSPEAPTSSYVKCTVIFFFIRVVGGGGSLPTLSRLTATD